MTPDDWLSPADHVRNLAGRYCAAVLSGDPAEFASCWVEAARWSVSGGRVFEGRDRIVDVFERSRAPFRLCVQELLSGVVEPAGEGSGASAPVARAVWQIRELQWRTDGTRTVLIGIYRDECVLDGESWRFASREFTEVERSAS